MALRRSDKTNAAVAMLGVVSGNEVPHPLFRVLADKGKTQRLINALELTPYSRNEFLQVAESSDEDCDDVESARRLMVMQRMSHGGLGQQWSYCVDASVGGYSASVRKFRAGAERLAEVHHRVQRVLIENLPFADLIPRYDRPATLFYCDPPYAPDTRAGGHGMNRR